MRLAGAPLARLRRPGPSAHAQDGRHARRRRRCANVALGRPEAVARRRVRTLRSRRKPTWSAAPSASPASISASTATCRRRRARSPPTDGRRCRNAGRGRPRSDAHVSTIRLLTSGQRGGTASRSGSTASKHRCRHPASAARVDVGHARSGARRSRPPAAAIRRDDRRGAGLGGVLKARSGSPGPTLAPTKGAAAIADVDLERCLGELLCAPPRRSTLGSARARAPPSTS